MDESNFVNAASQADVIEEETTADEVSDTGIEEENHVEEVKSKDTVKGNKYSSKEGL